MFRDGYRTPFYQFSSHLYRDVIRLELHRLVRSLYMRRREGSVGIVQSRNQQVLRSRKVVVPFFDARRTLSDNLVSEPVCEHVTQKMQLFICAS